MNKIEVAYRWVDGVSCTDAEWDKIDELLASGEIMSLNRNLSRILICESVSGELLGFLVFQQVPFCGPLYIRPEARGLGIANELANQMLQFLKDVQARGWLMIASSKHTVKLCEALGFSKIADPVYVAANPGSVKVEDALQQSSSTTRIQ